MGNDREHRTPSVFILTMGCAKNEVDSAAMEHALRKAGYCMAPDAAEADAVIVNTCSFIQAATEESIDAIFEAAALPRVEEGRAALIVAGCMPARYGDDLADELTEARAFVPCSREDDIVDVVASLVGRPSQAVDTADDDTASSAAPTFAYVKISDGCDRFCSYCTIPYIRGRYHSFSYECIASEVAREIEAGAREIVLIAQDTGRWGADFEEERDLAWLMSELASAYPATWFRVMYLQPEGITDELLAVMAANDNICSYLDIPLQHVNPAILRAMNRAGSAESFRALVERVTSVVPDITLRTTLIAGFPGETEEAFDQLLDFVNEGLFHYVGVFPYSREEGTRAYNLPDQLDEEEKAERAQILRDAADAASAVRVAERIGKSMPVLIEGVEEDGQLFGRAQCQAPDVDGVTYVSAGRRGEMVEATIVDTLLYEMEGE